MNIKKRKYLYEFRYRSGHKVMVHADDLTLKHNTVTGEITELKWENMYPRGMFINLRAVESVWKV